MTDVLTMARNMANNPNQSTRSTYKRTKKYFSKKNNTSTSYLPPISNPSSFDCYGYRISLNSYNTFNCCINLPLSTNLPHCSPNINDDYKDPFLDIMVCLESYYL